MALEPPLRYALAVNAPYTDPRRRTRSQWKPSKPDAGNVLERFFKFKQWNTSLKRDTLAGLTTFIVMSYIIFVNPSILGLDGRGPAVRSGAHVDLPRRRRHDHPHGPGHQPRLRHRARHGPQRGRRVQPGPRARV